MPTNDGWPSTTPRCWRPPTPPLSSPTSTSLPPVASSGDTASQPYPGSVQDSCSFVVHDLEPDDESDSWISDDDDPPALSSCSGPHPSLIPLCRCYAHGFWQHKGLRDIYKYSRSPLLEPYNFNDLLAEICDTFKDVVSSFEEPFYQVTLHTNNVVNFTHSVLCTLESLSSSGLMDQVFDSDPSGDLRHHTLMTLRTIVRCYYPAVFPTVGSQGAPGPHDPVGPALLVEIYDHLIRSLHSIAEASTQAPDFPLEVVPTNSKSRDRQRHWAATRRIQTSVNDVIPDTV